MEKTNWTKGDTLVYKKNLIILIYLYNIIGDYFNSNPDSNNRACNFGYRVDKFFFCHDERG